MTKQRWARIGLAAAAMLCALSLGLPYLYGKVSNRWLQKCGSVRPAQQGALSLEGQDNALAYTLYRNRFLSDVAIETASDPDLTRQNLQERTESLEEAGALPKHVAERARWILKQSDAQTSSKTENGFCSATYWVPEDEDANGGAVQATWQEKTGLVTFYSVSTSTKPENFEECLAAYRKYLGLDTLPDWTETTSTENGVCSWSQAGQLYLFCRWENNAVMMGVSSQNLDEEKGAA